MQRRRSYSLRSRLTLSLASCAFVAGAVLLGVCVFTGVGPNLGLPFGYYGKLNQVVARIEANPGVEIVQTLLNRDLTLEDFSITVRRGDEPEIDLDFGGASERPMSELFEELERHGL